MALRRRLGKQAYETIVPRALAEQLGIEVCTPSDLAGIDDADIKVLLRDDKDSWSAATVTIDSKSLVIINSSHAPVRQSSDLTHELAHILLDHEPARVDVTEDGLLVLNTYDGVQEDEANWFAGCILLPREALIYARRNGFDDARIVKEYGVSRDMVRFRLNVTAVDKQLSWIKGNSKTGP